MTILSFLKARLQEPSTIRGLIWLVMGSGIFGFHSSAISEISPVEAMLALSSVAAGLVGIVFPDKKTIIEKADTVVQADNVEQADVVQSSAKTDMKGS